MHIVCNVPKIILLLTDLLLTADTILSGLQYLEQIVGIKMYISAKL